MGMDRETPAQDRGVDEVDEALNGKHADKVSQTLHTGWEQHANCSFHGADTTMRCLVQPYICVDHKPKYGSGYGFGKRIARYALKEDMIRLGPEVGFEARTVSCGSYLLPDKRH